MLQNSMHSVFPLCVDDASLQKIELDFKSIKRVVRDSKRYGWSKDLLAGYRLVQDVDIPVMAILFHYDCIGDLRKNSAIRDFLFYIRE